MSGVLVTQGTQTKIHSIENAGTEIQIVKLDIGAGSAVSDFGGTITEVSEVANLADGTVAEVTNLAGGTVGIIEGGTIITDDFSFRHGDAFGSVGTVAGTATTTVVGSVAGSAVYVTDIVISTNGASEVTIGDGIETEILLGPLHLAENGGMVGNFVTPLNTSAGSNLIVKQTGSGTISVLAKGYID